MLRPRPCGTALSLAGVNRDWSAALDRPELCSRLFRVALFCLQVERPIGLREVQHHLESTCSGVNRLFLRFQGQENVEDVKKILVKICGWCKLAMEVDVLVDMLRSFDL